MVNLTERLWLVRGMVDAGQYFAINRARQYGKTTLLKALASFLSEDYVVAGIDFQKMSYANFESEQPRSMVAGSRYRLVHNYDGINWTIIVEVIFDDMEPFVQDIQ